MKYDHMVKVNGNYYQAGEDVPEIEYMAVDESLLPYSDADIEFETRENTSYTKSEINRMKTAELREMAKNTGVEGADDMTGQELKEYFISVFGL